VNQLAKGEVSNFDTLVTWLESVENFISRLSVYTDQTLPPAMVDIMAKIMEALISTLALVTRTLKKRKRGEFVLADMLPYSARRRQTFGPFGAQDGRRGHQGGPTAAGQTYTRRA
jgi:hypothetical protein